MHKKIKHIIAVSLVLSAVCGVLPADNLVLGLGNISVYASSDDDDDDDDFYEDAYLDGIYLSDGDIDFSKEDTEYTVTVDKDVEKITIKAKPEDDDYIVEINDTSVEEDDDYKRTISLDEGKNTIKIYVESDDEDETYTLNVYRGGTSSTSTTSTSSTGTSTNTTNQVQTFTIKNEINKFNVWTRVDGKWKYIDGTGAFLKNQWWFDKNTGINYHLGEDGYRTTGWFADNNNWYYFNENGEMQTGWICLDKNWYYLNKSGVMKKGWLEDSTGNWYYLENSGAMKTGWVENSDGRWYYLDSTGKMIKDSTVSGYKLGKDGSLIN